MSIVAVVVKKKGFTMAADSIVLRGWDTQDKGKRSDATKMFEVNDIVIGRAGYLHELALLRIYASTRQPESATSDGIIRFMTEFAEWKKKRTEDGTVGNHYLIGFQGAVFMFMGWSASRVTTHEAVGAGEPYALAAMHLGHSAKKAVEVACELSCYCEQPILEITKKR